jgi:glucose/arabinose dehydrogenase
MMRPAQPITATLVKAALALAVALVPAGVHAGAPPQPGIAPVTLRAEPYVFDTAEQHRLRVVVVARGLKHPFSLALLPDGDALVAERGGALRRVRNVAQANGAPAVLDAEPVAGLPKLAAPFRNGGLHDLGLHPGFAGNGLVYFTFNKAGVTVPARGDQPARTPGITTLMRARYADGALSQVQELYAAGEYGGNIPAGSRLAFEGSHVYLTTGAPFGGDAQELGSAYGKVLRVREDGGIPTDNPFVKQEGARPEIFSLGHRDHLGLTAANGRVFNAEHGPNGGDEVNLILPGRNYGWPQLTFGRGYDGAVLAESPVGAGFEPPLLIWLPSIAPSGLQFYTGERFPAWKGNLFVGSVRRGEIPRTGGLERVVFNDKLQELRRETLLTGLHQRIRDVRQGPDGLLYVVTDEDDGALLRLEPTD